ncbi:hypothetical protein [Streptococcus parasanguinis]|uniref:hypothetical protein n=1 Tax=Streptococcus parasanguinis TaxID=1318 RepID=UPI0034A59D7D
MNQNDWVEYFEAINGRKPSMQEFQEAREKGEFVVERKETPTPITEAQVPAQEAPVAPSAPLSQESTAFIPPHPVPRPKRSTLSFNKPTKFGLAVVAIVTAITLVWIFFFTGTQSLNGIWLSNTDSMPVVYELNGKTKKVNTTLPIKKIIEGKEAKKEFVQKLSALNLPNIQTLADVDKKFHLKTKEVVIFKTDGLALYNLLQSNGTNVIFSDDLDDLAYYKSNLSEFKKRAVFQKIEYPDVLVGKWKNVTNNDDHLVFQITKNGASNTDVTAIYPLVDTDRINDKSGNSHSSDDKINTEFKQVQKEIKNQGYTVNSAREVYKEAYTNSYIVPVDGGKKVIVLDKDYNFKSMVEKVK